MPLPPEFLAARDRMYQAEDELRAYVDSAEHDRNRHRQLVENLQQRIREFEASVAALLQRP